ncbi:RNA polymerase sigma factor [Tundrisphaera sp. TA3]|uniref:RNA polymerase sigma factor n=1 Tax=Tundrisphaera sp. TA3 TaxID=3435775 RepID=UPI003EB986D2
MANGRGGAALGSIGSVFGVGASAGLDDARLIERFLAGRGEAAEAAFEALVIRHGPMVLGVCRRTLRDADAAQDAFQATFLVLATRAGSIRCRDGLAGWLYGVARKVATRAKADAARRRLREREAGTQLRPEPSPGPEPDELAALFEEINRLPGTYRDPVILCHLDGMTYEAAARELGCPLGTLSIRLKRARERLRTRLERRGLDVPASVLAAGRVAGSSAPPAAWAGQVARSAVAWKVGGTAASGMVPAAVSALARRTIMAMRFQVLGLGVLALGGVAVAASASLAMIPGADRPDAPATKAEAKPARSWVQTLPGGAKVRLVGVSTYPSGPNTWRTPDGEPLTAPCERSGFQLHPDVGQKVRVFAISVINTTDERASYRWEITPSAGATASSHPFAASGEEIPGLGSVAVCLPADRRTCTVRAGVASGAWKTLLTNGPGSGSIMSGDFGATFADPTEIPNRPARDGGPTSLTLSHDVLDGDVRVVAVDAQGKETAPVRQSSGGTKNFRQVTVGFDLPLASIREFRLQSRPFEWAEFADVPVDPPLPASTRGPGK